MRAKSLCQQEIREACKKHGVTYHRRYQENRKSCIRIKLYGAVYTDTGLFGLFQSLKKNIDDCIVYSIRQEVHQHFIFSIAIEVPYVSS